MLNNNGMDMKDKIIALLIGMIVIIIIMIYIKKLF